MSGVAVKVLAADALARLQGMEERGSNLTGVFRSFGGYMKGSIEKNFAAGGRPAKWTTLKITSLLSWSYGFKKGGTYRTKKGGPTKKGRTALAGRLPLTASGVMRRSIHYAAEPRAISIIAGPSDYAAIHQFGGKAGRGRKVTIPARPYLLFQDEDINYFDRLALEFIMTGRML